ncbi:MAG: TetR family transcriptional regulator [Erythrobacter sp.]|nr:TetR family transcriptional regulator [Erythrobacter sp.]
MMSTQAHSDFPAVEKLLETAISRKPRQGRSLASFERMLEATRELMLERGSEDFTLQDVSNRGNVSIGSIYLRFESKDRLLYAVIGQELQTIVEREAAMVEAIASQSGSLKEFLAKYIEAYIAFMAEHATMLRAIMQRAAIDPVVSPCGKEAGHKALSGTADVILSFRDEIKGDDPRGKSEAVLHMIFASVARRFGLGVSAEAADPMIWERLRPQLSEMAYAYLIYSD